MIRDKGFTLIEVLIALIIVAVGVLGHAKMQAKSMRTAQQAQFSQTANTGLLDLAERIRANSDMASSFIYENLTDGDDVESTNNCSTNTCSDDQFAQAELAEWFNHLQNNLPSPRFSIVKSSNIYTLSLFWDGTKAGEWLAGTVTCDNTISYQCGSMDVWVK